MRRVLVIGSGGAGKSTFATKLGAKTGLPVIHLDVAFWKPGWVESPADEWKRTVEGLVRSEAWIMDGNFGGTLDLRLDACDTVIFLDRATRWLCLWRVALRLLRFHGRHRPDMAPGCTEGVDREFLRWIWNFPHASRPRILERLAALPRGKDAVVLRSERQIEEFLAKAPR